MSRQNILLAAEAAGIPVFQKPIEEFLERFIAEFNRLESLPKKRKHYMVMVKLPHDACPISLSGFSKDELLTVAHEDGYTVLSEVIEVEYTP